MSRINPTVTIKRTDAERWLKAKGWKPVALPNMPFAPANWQDPMMDRSICLDNAFWHQLVRESDDALSPGLEMLCQALGWQGGTIHQVVAEIQQLQKCKAMATEQDIELAKLRGQMAQLQLEYEALGSQLDAERMMNRAEGRK